MRSIMLRSFSLLIIAFTGQLQAQEVKFGKVSKEELLEETYPHDEAAPAAVLYRHHQTSFNYVSGSGFQLVTNVHERVKIYSKEGLEYATVSEKLYQSNKGDEGISGRKGYTFNLVDGKVERTKLKGSDTFTTEINEYYDEESFTMPDVKEGSIIEYQYRRTSPYFFRLDDILLQYDIPIAYQEVIVQIPEYFYYQPMMRGSIPVTPKYSKVNASLKVASYTGGNSVSEHRQRHESTVDYTTNITKFVMDRVPALEEEPFVNDMDNYRSMVSYELQQIKFPNAPLEDFSSSWEKVAKSIMEDDDFGGQLKVRGFHKDWVAPIIADAASNEEKTMRIYQALKKHMVWDGTYGYYSTKGVKKALQEKTGDAGDINLLLIGMLRAAGFDANPVLISTRSHGIPIFPSLYGFNYVVAAVDIAGKRVYLDAVNDYLKPGRVNPQALNWTGRVLKDNGKVELVSLYPKRPSSLIHTMDVALDANGSLNGQLRTTHTDYNAYEFRVSKLQQSEDEYLEELANDHGGMDITSYSRSQDREISKPVMEELTFQLDGQANIGGDQIFFNPLFFNSMEENPFKRDTRSFPVDYNYPRQKKVMMFINLPEGYEVTHLPEPARMLLPDNLGSYSYMVMDQGNGKLLLKYDMKIDSPVIAPDYYPYLKEFYKNIILKHAEKVVLSKTTTDGTAEGSAGGR